jgi:hypothetical protein
MDLLDDDESPLIKDGSPSPINMGINIQPLGGEVGAHGDEHGG